MFNPAPSPWTAFRMRLQFWHSVLVGLGFTAICDLDNQASNCGKVKKNPPAASLHLNSLLLYFYTKNQSGLFSVNIFKYVYTFSTSHSLHLYSSSSSARLASLVPIFISLQSYILIQFFSRCQKPCFIWSGWIFIYKFVAIITWWVRLDRVYVSKYLPCMPI